MFFCSAPTVPDRYDTPIARVDTANTKNPAADK